MSFRYIVVCDEPNCHRQQGIRTSVVRSDCGGVFKEDLPRIGWKEDEEGRHTCPFCANPCPMCGGDGQVDCERPPGTYIKCSTCDGRGIAPAQKEKEGGEN
jgi:hypothetical protein